jgi:flagellar protein FliT
MSHSLLQYYQAIEQASEEMLDAARREQWDEVLGLESTCAILVAQLKHEAKVQELAKDQLELKNKIMQRILNNDARIRVLAEPWIEDLDRMMEGRPIRLH